MAFSLVTPGLQEWRTRVRWSLFQSLAAAGAPRLGAHRTGGAADGMPRLSDLPALHCVSNAQGWFYAGTADAAAHLADDTTAVAQDFGRHFGKPAPRGVVIAAGTGQPIPATATEVLKAAGAAWQLPWLDAAERRGLQRSAVENQLRAQFPDASDADIRARRHRSAGPPRHGGGCNRSQCAPTRDRTSGAGAYVLAGAIGTLGRGWSLRWPWP